MLEREQEAEKVWLFGSNYGYLYGRTKNSVNESGSNVAGVGVARPGVGVAVGRWNADVGHDFVHVVRLVVAKKK